METITSLDQAPQEGSTNEEPQSSEASETPKPKPPAKKAGRRKISIEYIEDKSRRHITFSKRKAGIMKKAYELSTLTGTQVLLLVASETGHVYTFATTKLQPLITKPEGKNLIQACLNAPDVQPPPPVTHQRPIQPPGYGDPNLLYHAQPTDPLNEGVYGTDKPDKVDRSRQHDPRAGFPSPLDMGQMNFPNTYSSNRLVSSGGMAYPLPTSALGGMAPRYANLMGAAQPPAYPYQASQFPNVPGHQAAYQAPHSAYGLPAGWPSGGPKQALPIHPTDKKE